MEKEGNNTLLVIVVLGVVAVILFSNGGISKYTGEVARSRFINPNQPEVAGPGGSPNLVAYQQHPPTGSPPPNYVCYISNQNTIRCIRPYHCGDIVWAGANDYDHHNEIPICDVDQVHCPAALNKADSNLKGFCSKVGKRLGCATFDKLGENAQGTCSIFGVTSFTDCFANMWGKCV